MTVQTSGERLSPGGKRSDGAVLSVRLKAPLSPAVPPPPPGQIELNSGKFFRGPGKMQSQKKLH